MKLYETLTGKEVSIVEVQKTDYKSNYLFPVWGAQYLVKNPRDLPIMHMILNNLAFTLIAIPLVWYFQSHLMGIMYLCINYIVFFGRFMCLNHEYAHLQIFKLKRLGDVLSTLILGHSHGVPFGSYYIQHVVMHHKGANVWGVDLSSTERYDRENNFHFIHYWLRRYSPLGFVFDAVYTCIRYGRYKVGISYGVVSLLWFYLVFYIVLYTEYWVSGLWTMLIPLFLTSLFGGIGGWMQHFFLNPKRPRKWYSYDLINSYANSHGFNQGFHNVHHTLGNLHWTELPSGFLTLLNEYHKDDVMMIQGIDNVEVAYLVFTKKYDILSRYLVTTKPGGHDMKFCINFIRSHLKPVYVIEKLKRRSILLA